MDKRKLVKLAALICVGASLNHTMCLNFGGWGKWGGQIAWDAAEYALFEFVADNDGVFDLFQDDFGTGTQYDDRFADPSRAEPDGFAAAELGTGG